ncbi:MAG: polymer-forming cytoskeletal protein [Pseudomonadota bacterium]
MGNASPTSRSAPSRPAASAPSIIGSDVEIIGNVMTNGEIQLDGAVEGDVRAASVTMGENGTMHGTLTADRVIVRGRVDGSINGRIVELHKTARVTGDVKHNTLSIEAGAQVDGHFKYGAETGGVEAVKPKDMPDFTLVEDALKVTEKAPAKAAVAKTGS